MPRLRLRLGLGPLALGFALSLGRCGGGPPLMYAYAEESEPALVLVEDGQGVDDNAPELETSETEPEPEPETSETEPEPEPETSEPEPETSVTEPEPEPETSETEPEPEPESSDRDAQIEQSATTEDVLEHIDAVAERLDAAVDLLMIAAGGIGALLGTIAFGKLWGPLAGER